MSLRGRASLRFETSSAGILLEIGMYRSLHVANCSFFAIFYCKNKASYLDFTLDFFFCTFYDCISMVTVVGLEFERSNFFVIFLPHKPGGVASIKVFEVTLFRISH